MIRAAKRRGWRANVYVAEILDVTDEVERAVNCESNGRGTPRWQAETGEWKSLDPIDPEWQEAFEELSDRCVCR